MCKTLMGANASEPSRRRSSRSQGRQNQQTPPIQPPNKRSTSMSTTATSSTTTSSNSSKTGASTSSAASSSSVASRRSLASLRESLPENPHIYAVSEIRAATNNFLAHRLSSSSSKASWRCNLRGKEVVVFQRKFRRRIAMDELKERLSDICRSHHGSIINLLGASVSGSGGGDHIYLVYEYIHGASLADCLRNPKNPNFTVLSRWTSRIQIATDLAHGLDYIHNKTGLKVENLVHNHIKSSAVIVTEPEFNAKICHFGTAQLCGETDEMSPENDGSTEPKRSDSRALRFEGIRGYMSPEFQASGNATQKSDIYAFGVMLLELLSGEEPLKYKYDKTTANFERTSVIETAEIAMEGGDSDREGKLRRWMDRRLGDSFPVTVVEKLTKLALECVQEDPKNRPEMGRVAGKISQLYLESEKWSANMKRPTEITASFTPR